MYLDGLRNKVFTRHSLLLCLFFGPTGMYREREWEREWSCLWRQLVASTHLRGVRPAGVVSHLLTRAVTGAVRGEKLEDIMLAGADKDL